MEMASANQAGNTLSSDTMDLEGSEYTNVLSRLHSTLNPRSYLEIGVNAGRSFALARCASIGIDPAFAISDPSTMIDILKKPVCMMFNMGSDAFFRQFNPSELLGKPIEMAFLDGLHRCEFCNCVA
jgi:hypothetical protein